MLLKSGGARRRLLAEAGMNAKSVIFAVAVVGLGLSAQAQSASPPGTASPCSGCHAPRGLGSPVASIAGRDPNDIVTAMQEFRSGARSATVMDRIAKGFSDDEVRAIVASLGAQR